MAFDPDYGETRLTEEERDALTPAAREILGDPIYKADLYDLEQQIQNDVADELVGRVWTVSWGYPNCSRTTFVRGLHRRLYAPVWAWGGRQRARETNIGIAPQGISVELRNALDDLLYRWEHQSGITARALGIQAHAALVRIHPLSTETVV